MKVLQINAVNKISSTGRTASELSEYLWNNGHECINAYSKGVSVDKTREFVIGNNVDTKLHGLFSRVFGLQGYFSKTATKKLLRFMDNYNPDVIILRNLHGNYINLPLLLKYLAKNDIATVAVLHDCWFFTGKCCHYTVDGCYKWQEKCGSCPSLKKYNKSWFFDRTAKMLSDKKKLFGAIPRLAVVGVSDWLINEAKKAPVFENAKVFKRIYNWIDTETFSPQNSESLRQRLGLIDKKVILAVAGGWSKEKGIDTLLDISKQLTDDEKLVIVGNISNIELNDNIIHLPATTSVDELAEIYSLADVFVQPSLEETFGKVTAEALATGTPAVCFNSTANPELIGEGCGSVVETGDINAFIRKVQEIAQNSKQEHIAVCRAFAVNNFDKDTNFKEYLNLFEEIIVKE